MGLISQIGSFIGGLFRPRANAKPNAKPAKPSRPPSVVGRGTGAREIVNDASSYGVAVTPAAATPGAPYWQATRIHHLTQEENGGNHHIYLDVVDPAMISAANPIGRVRGARLKITWDGGEQTVEVDKPIAEPGTNFPMWRGQVCSVAALGLPGQELPSDQVAGLHTGHPDEAPGNTLFHHSFQITFQRGQGSGQVVRGSISGVVRNGASRTALLIRDGQQVASVVIGLDGAFRFTGLTAGEYVVAVEGTTLRSEPQRLQGQEQVRLELVLVMAQSSLSGRVRNGAGRTIRLLRDGATVGRCVVGTNEIYWFTGLPAGVYQVTADGANVLSATVRLDGVNSATADLALPVNGRPLVHYVLFGPAEQAATRANLLLAQDYLLAFAASFGFSPAEAAGAGLVTVIADEKTIGAEVVASLTAAGATVQRISGSVAEVSAALAERIARKQPFPPGPARAGWTGQGGLEAVR